MNCSRDEAGEVPVSLVSGSSHWQGQCRSDALSCQCDVEVDSVPVVVVGAENGSH